MFQSDTFLLALPVSWGSQTQWEYYTRLQIYLPLPNAFNVKNSVQLTDDLLNISFDPNLQFVSFDIMDMYSNVPTEDLINIIDSMCDKHNINDTLKHKLINISNTIIKQNYFQFLSNFYLQEKGLAIGCPPPSTFSEIYLQYIKNTAIYYILRHNKIAGYFRYVDDILIVYNNTTTNIHNAFNSLSKLMPTMKFTMGNKIDNTINFLDITTTKEPDKLEFSI
jgi:hypothetical protein